MTREKPTRPTNPRSPEEASATVELALLLPVYILLFIGVFSIGQLVVIRQEVVLAVRYQAWLGTTPAAQSKSSMDQSFFRGFTPYSKGVGYTQTTPPNPTDVKLDQGIYASAYTNPTGASPGAMQLAKDVLNDKAGKAHLKSCKVSGKFHYQPEWMGAFLGSAMSEPATDCSVYVRVANAERKVLDMSKTDPQAVTNRNPIEDYTTPNSFQISQDLAAAQTNRFFSPGTVVINQGANTGTDGMADDNKTLTPAIDPGKNPNLWGNDFRIAWDNPFNVSGSSTDAPYERDFFHVMLYNTNYPP
jgi:hypothetical protein